MGRATHPPSLRTALNEYRPGHALPRTFSIDPAIYAHELEKIWRASWLCVGAGVQAAGPGGFFTVELDEHSLIVVRGADGALHALHNTCRHRGMPVCSAQSGRAERWVCPYHQWSYELDGRLRTCGGMDDQLRAEDYGLSKAPVAEIGGLVFVWLGQSPAPLEQAADELARAMASQGLDRAKVAHQRDYDVRANWKLVWENNRECWHCHAGHPEYIRANFDTAPDNERTRDLISRRVQDHERLLAELAVVDHPEPGLYRFPSPDRWWSANRSPLAPGFVTESVDGAPVAPLMGDYPDYDVGTLRLRGVPNFWCHASADHAVLTWLAPAGPERTRIRVQWLVDADAREGLDYTLDRLLPFWQLTSEQDWSLCEQNYRGVRNPAFRPGPYSVTREYNVISFCEWYLSRL